MTARRLSRQGHDHQIAPGVFGWLEAPDSTIAVADCVLVCGWVFASGTRVVSLRATGAGPDRPLSHGLRRDDVLQAYPEEPSARESGFFAYLELGDQPLKAAALQIWATLADGRSIELFTCDLLPATSQGSVIRRAIRQVIARPRLLLSSRAWIGALRLILARPGGAPSSARATAHSDALSRTSLAAFLASGARLSLSAPAAPVVSVIVVVWNRADLTLGCLRALTAQSEVDAEVIVVDNGSTDDTREMLARLSGVLIVRNDTNLGFTLAANIGARRACGEFLLFLNNDAELIPGALAQLLETARRSSSIGAVGGKLVFPDGRLQEAGAIIWSDGSCDAYGRGDAPGAPEYNFERAVD